MTRRVGLAGYGSAGRGIHAPLLAAAGLSVVAAATSNPQRAAAARDELPAVDIVPDLDALLTRDLDLVVLATPSGGHAAQALRAIDAGIAVVVDKPLAVSADEALEVVETAARRKVPLTVFQNRRFDPEQATANAVAASGAIGRVHRADLRWERWRPEPKDRWRENADPGDGGGIMLDLHSHLVDAAVQLLGPVRTVYAEIAARTTRAEDDAFLACTHVDGAISHLSASSLVGAPGPRLRLLGDRGAYVLASLAEEPTMYVDLADDDGHCGWIVRGEARHRVDAVPVGQADFYRAVSAALAHEDPTGRMPVDPRDAVHVLAVLDAARLSARASRVVEVITPGGRPG